MMMSDIERNGEEIMRLQSRMAIVEDATQRQAVSMARIDENIKAIRQSVEKMANEDNVRVSLNFRCRGDRSIYSFGCGQDCCQCR